jgi:hypothetical protein
MKSPGSVAQVGSVAFELSRFEVVDDRCQVEGRWFGVRGRRFMRPALTVVVDGQSVRLLADLADKPWAAEDGEIWTARFPHTIERADSREAELTVAPDLTITLPVPERLTAAARGKPVSRRGDGSGQRGHRRAGGGSDIRADTASKRVERPGRKSRSPEDEGERDAVDALMQELVDLRDTQRRLRQRLERVEADKARAAHRLDKVSGELSAAVHERDESNAARDRTAAELEAVQRERSEFVAERDTARQERRRMAVDREAAERTHDQVQQASEAAGAARDRALSERGAALAAQRQAASERDDASSARDRAVAERDAAFSLRDHAVAERDAAVSARDGAVSSGEELSRTAERLDSELSDLRSARGAALVMRSASHAPVVSRRYANVFLGAIAIAIVLAIVLIVLVLLHVV